MLIPITSHDSDTPEWALVELQGRIEPLHEVDLQETLQIGTLQLSKTVRQLFALGCRPTRLVDQETAIKFEEKLLHQPQPPCAAPCNCCVQNKDVVQLQIGYHILEGKKLPLKKPMAILETLKDANTPSSSSSPDNEPSSSGDSTYCKVGMSRCMSS